MNFCNCFGLFTRYLRNPYDNILQGQEPVTLNSESSAEDRSGGTAQPQRESLDISVLELVPESLPELSSEREPEVELEETLEEVPQRLATTRPEGISNGTRDFRPEETPEVARLESTDESEYDDSTDSADDMSEPDYPPVKSGNKLPNNPALLQKRLLMARVENPPGSHKFYIPETRKKEIITYDVVTEQIRLAHKKLNPEQVDIYARAVIRSARNLFAVLASVKKGGTIIHFLNEEITDEDLPFQRGSIDSFSYEMKTKGGRVINCLAPWDFLKQEAISCQQWWMLVPVFSIGDHEDLHDNIILPFIPLPGPTEKDSKPSAGGGGYSEVKVATIHEAHHDFGEKGESNDKEMKVAIKQLHSKDESDFIKEQSILKTLRKRPHAHLVKLLASYSHQGRYHFIFPCATSNLRTFWEEHPNPIIDRETILWSLKQMKGISGGLLRVHEFQTTVDLSVEGDVRVTQDRKKLSVIKGEEKFGRHGDIKPENILWFEQLSEDDDERGTLQIADFGLGRFHGRDTKTKQAPYTIFSSPTYEPPECHVYYPVSRKYDFWSLGCLYLEFVSWLLMGWQAINDFAHTRAEDSYILNEQGKIRDDYFWTLLLDGSTRGAKIREGVEIWIRRLREHSKCSKLIQDLLDLVMGRLLRIRPQDRIDARQLHLCLRDMLEQAEKDEEYLIAPAPSQPEEMAPSPNGTNGPGKKVAFDFGN